MTSNSRIFLFLILLGLTIRLLLTSLPGLKVDMDSWFAWAIRLNEFNFSNFYSKQVFTDYTPGYLYVLSLLGFLKNLFSLSDSLFTLILKLPAIIAEIIIGFIVYKEIKKYFSLKTAFFTSGLILLNPVLIFNSSIWGQVDSILTLLLLLSVTALKDKSLILSSIFFGLALITKPQALAILPVYFLFLITNLKVTNILKISIPAFLILLTLSYPFFPNQTILNLGQHILNTANEYPYTSMNAYNLWGIAGFWVPDSIKLSGLSLRDLGIAFFLAYWAILGYLFLKKKLPIYLLASLATLGFFFLPTRVHERYLYPAIVFLILIIPFIRRKLFLVLTGILSLLHFLNLYYVYVYYNEFYFGLPKLLYSPLIYNLSSESAKELSLISTVIFILICITVIKYHAISKKA